MSTRAPAIATPALPAGCSDHAGVTIVGVRSMTSEESTFAAERGVTLFERRAEPITDIDAVLDTLSENVYVSFDLDAFDPSIMAAVGTPEPGGMLWWEALRILRAVGERRRIVGFDVVELAPDEGPEACTYTAAKLTYKLFSYAMLGHEARIDESRDTIHASGERS